MPFPVDERFILQTEHKLGLRFPTSFRNKMMADNGGEVETPPDSWQLYPFFDSSDKKRLKRTCNDITRETITARESFGFPSDAIAIGGNGSGDHLVLFPSTNPSQLQDTVYWWDHEMGNIIKVANDFSELV